VPVKYFFFSFQKEVCDQIKKTALNKNGNKKVYLATYSFWKVSVAFHSLH